MKLNLDNQFLNLKGYPLANKMDETLATVLALSITREPKKMMDWATELINNGEIEVNSSDLLFLRALIESTNLLNNLFKSQLMDQVNMALNKVE